MSHYCHSARSTAGCTALLIGILCAAGWLPAFSEEPPPRTTPLELTQVPVDALAFLQLRPADLLQGEVGKSCQARHTLARLLETFEVVKRVGVSLPEMEKLTLVWPTEKHAFSPLIVVTTIEQIDRTRLLATLLPECRAHQLKGQTYCTSPKTGRKAIRFLGEHVFVEGAVEDIVQLLIKPPSPAARGAQTPALDWAAENHSVVVGLRLPEEQTEEDRQQLYLALPKEGPLQTLLPPLVKPLKAVQSVALRMDTEKSLDL